MKKVSLLVISLVAAFSLMSCGSKPAPEPEKTPETPVVETPVETPIEEPIVEDEPIPEPEPIDVASIVADIDEARKLAVEAGAENLAPDLLKEIDDYYASLKESDVDLAARSAEIILRYKTLASFAKAKDLKNQIDEHDLAGYAQRDYDAGVQSFEIVEKAYESSEPMTLDISASADSAVASFTVVYFAGYKKLAKDERAAAYDAKKLADSVKAGVSRKTEYTAATEEFKKGDTLYAMQNPVKSYESYKSAKETYTYLYTDVSEKRAAAMAALEEAKKRVEESAQFAEEADYKAPITEPIEGIEDEDAVLLEADNYENPEDAEIEVSEDLTIMDQVNIVTGEVSNALEGTEAGEALKSLPKFGE